MSQRTLLLPTKKDLTPLSWKKRWRNTSDASQCFAHLRNPLSVLLSIFSLVDPWGRLESAFVHSDIYHWVWFSSTPVDIIHVVNNIKQIMSLLSFQGTLLMALFNEFCYISRGLALIPSFKSQNEPCTINLLQGCKWIKEKHREMNYECIALQPFNCRGQGASQRVPAIDQRLDTAVVLTMVWSFSTCSSYYIGPPQAKPLSPQSWQCFFILQSMCGTFCISSVLPVQ